MGIVKHESLGSIQNIRRGVQTELQHGSPGHYWDGLPVRFKKSHRLKPQKPGGRMRAIVDAD